jgi:hypothetical protein
MNFVDAFKFMHSYRDYEVSSSQQIFTSLTMPEITDFLIDLVSDLYVLSDNNRLAFSVQLVKMPKHDWQAVQRMMGTSTSEAFPKKTSAFWDHIPLPEKQQ